ncbi:hypothetical protein B7L88_gp066 [Rhizobium phage RHEph10]|uniref:hypothetical protein n=1 Tax=Rhizobium phage RHEph10 TaxID=1220717 RepID=UPI0002AB21E7|nr:hypothetical protein B7L88_gp066 [Rhizobium phage RHEph10]AGC36110.1 hypothetical protein RHEph10_gp066 [Rhizobium phage RHEph10]
MIPREITTLKRRLIREIKAIVLPHLWESGYRTRIDPKGDRLSKENSRPWKIWCPRDKNGKPKEQVFHLGGSILDEFEGLSEDGPVSEFYVGAVWIGWGALPVEDLIKLKAWCLKRFAAQKVAA